MSVEIMQVTITKWGVTISSILFLSIVGCKPQGVIGKPQPGDKLDYVKISYEISSDIIGGTHAKAYEIFVHNLSSSGLENVVFTINDEYKAPLKDIIVCHYFSIFQTTRKYGNGHLPADTTFAFRIDHDVSNNCVFLNVDGDRLPTNTMNTKIKIECDKGIGEWKFEPSMTRYQMTKVVEPLFIGVVVLTGLTIVLVLNAIW